MSSDQNIRVMIVDDSAVVRQTISAMIENAPGIEVIATAADPLFAITKMRQAWPDVIVLDVEMPRMDGLSFLRKVMAERPTPVIICSSLAETGSDVLMQALSAGAFSVVTKPKSGLKSFLEESSSDIVSLIREAAKARVGLLVNSTAKEKVVTQATTAPNNSLADSGEFMPKQVMQGLGFVKTTDKVIAIGTSTGGTQALEKVLTALPKTIPGIVIVQHMPEKFTAMFAERLNSLCAIEVREAVSNDRVLPGVALIAPGGKHMRLRRNGAQYHVEVLDGPLVNRHRPSVDVLFKSVAQSAGGNAVGVIMTGMGNDGALGLKEMHDAGAQTFAQDEASCVVFGMPMEAIKLGAADRVLALELIPGALVATDFS